jgi:four helix bundle protein
MSECEESEVTYDMPLGEVPSWVMEANPEYSSLRQRTKMFSRRVMRVCNALPENFVALALGKQFIRSGTSVGANYRAACRAKSRADFIHKMKIVEEEADESAFWMELLMDEGIVEAKKLLELHGEAGELVAIAVSSIKTAKAGNDS